LRFVHKKADGGTLTVNIYQAQAELSKEFGGSATAAGATYSGQMTRLKNQMGEVSESIGGKILPYLSKFGDYIIQNMPKIRQAIDDAITKATTIVDGLKNAIKFVIDNSNILIPVLGGVASAVVALNVINTVKGLMDAWKASTIAQTFAQGGLNAVMAANPIGIIVIAIGALVAAGIALYMNWDKVSAFLKATWEGLKTSVTSIFSGMGKAISDTYNNIKDAITNTWNSIVTGTMAILQPFIDAIVGFFNKLTAPITQIFEGLKQFFSAVFDVIKNIFLGAILLILDLVTGNFGKLSEDAQGMFNNLKTAFADIWSAIGKVFSGAMSVISIALQTGWDLIKSGAIALWEGIKTAISAIWDGIVWIFKNMTIPGIIITHWDTIKNTTTNVFNGLKTFFTGIWDGIATYLKNLPETFKNSGVNMFNSLLDGIKSVWTTITGFIENSMTWLREKLSFWKSSQKEMSSDGKGSGGATINVPSYAVGTPFVPNDGLAFIHKGEAIIPAQYNPYNNENSNGDSQSKSNGINNIFNGGITIKHVNNLDDFVQQLNNTFKKPSMA
jgi:phage-related protein